MNLKEDNSLASPEKAPLGPQLLNQIEEFTELCRSQGIHVKPHHGPKSLAHFETLELDRQNSIVKDFSAYFALLKQLVAMDISLKEDRRLVWNALKLLGLKPADTTVLESIHDGDVVEFYNSDKIQIFRNVRFMELCDYTVYEVLTVDWPTLYDREDEITNHIIREVHEAMEGKASSVRFSVPVHRFRQKYVAQQKLLECEFILRCPLHQQEVVKRGVPEAILVSLRVTPVLEPHAAVI